MPVELNVLLFDTKYHYVYDGLHNLLSVSVYLHVHLQILKQWDLTIK